MKEILADTSVIIDYLEDNTSKEADDWLESRPVIISIVTYYEVCRFFLQIGKPKEMEEVKNRLKNFEIKGLTMEICEEAARISNSNRFSIADSVICATAKVQGVRLLTSDSDLKGMKDVVFLHPKKI